MPALRRATEALARRTSRRGLFGRWTDLAFGALAGTAAGTTAASSSVSAGVTTVCAFPGPPCPCLTCRSNGLCFKPCLIFTQFYASGCWVTGNVTCCDCNCEGYSGITACGCGSDYHNDPSNCPNGTADG